MSRNIAKEAGIVMQSIVNQVEELAEELPPHLALRLRRLNESIVSIFNAHLYDIENQEPPQCPRQ